MWVFALGRGCWGQRAVKKLCIIGGMAANTAKKTPGKAGDKTTTKTPIKKTGRGNTKKGQPKEQVETSGGRKDIRRRRLSLKNVSKAKKPKSKKQMEAIKGLADYERFARIRKDWKKEADAAEALPTVSRDGKVARRDKKTLTEETEMTEKQLERIGRIEASATKKEKTRENIRDRQKTSVKIDAAIRAAVEPLNDEHMDLGEFSQLLERTLAGTAHEIMKKPDARLFTFEVFWLALGAVESRVRSVMDIEVDKDDVQMQQTKQDLLRMLNRLAEATVLSAVSTMCQIVPGYRVVEEESGHKQKKDMVALKRHESEMMKMYSSVVVWLTKAKSMQRHPSLVVHSACELLAASPNFNESERLMTHVIKIAGGAFDLDDCLRETSRQTLFRLIDQDPSLLVGSLVAKSIYDLCSHKRADVESVLCPEILHVLSAPELERKKHSAEVEMLHRQLSERQLKGKKKHERRDLMKGTVAGDLQVIAKRQAEILEHMFMLYVRVLHSPDKHNQALVMKAIAGVGAQGGHTNVKLVGELLSTLRRIYEKFNPTPTIGLALIESALKLAADTIDEIIVDVSWAVEAYQTVGCQLLPYMYRGLVPELRVLTSANPVNRLSRPPAELLASGDALRLGFERLDVASRRAGISANSVQLDASVADECFVQFVRTTVLMINSPAVIGVASTSVHSLGAMSNVLRLVETLGALIPHLDPTFADVLRCVLEKHVFSKYPKSRDSLDPEGAILSSRAGAVSIYWSLDLLTCKGDDKVSRDLIDIHKAYSETLQALQYRRASSYRIAEETRAPQKKSLSMFRAAELFIFVALPSASHCSRISCVTSADFVKGAIAEVRSGLVAFSVLAVTSSPTREKGTEQTELDVGWLACKRLYENHVTLVVRWNLLVDCQDDSLIGVPPESVQWT